MALPSKIPGMRALRKAGGLYNHENPEYLPNYNTQEKTKGRGQKTKQNKTKTKQKKRKTTTEKRLSNSYIPISLRGEAKE